MPFYKKAYSKQHGVYYPRAVVQGKPVETETIAKDLARISTVSNSDVQAVLGDIAPVIHARMAQGKSVHIKGLGYFRYTLDTVGVKKLEDFDFAKQVKAVHIEFIPEREKITSGTYSRALVDSEQLEWIEINPAEEEVESEVTGVLDLKTQKTDWTLSRGQMAKFLGNGLILVGADGTSPGQIDFYRSDNPDTSVDTVTIFGYNTDTEVIFVVPIDLTEGKYRVKLTTYYSGGDEPLEEPRVIECPEVTLV